MPHTYLRLVDANFPVKIFKEYHKQGKVRASYYQGSDVTTNIQTFQLLVPVQSRTCAMKNGEPVT